MLQKRVRFQRLPLTLPTRLSQQSFFLLDHCSALSVPVTVRRRTFWLGPAVPTFTSSDSSLPIFGMKERVPGRGGGADAGSCSHRILSIPWLVSLLSEEIKGFIVIVVSASDQRLSSTQIRQRMV
jgi:hypothetical protein